MAFFNIWRTPIYINIMRDKVEITNLATGETASQSAIESFSTSRTIVGKFDKAAETIKAAIGQLGTGGGIFPPSYKVLIHQTEGAEGGLSDVEKRALRDLGELFGDRMVYISERDRRLTKDEAVEEIAKKPR